FSVPGRLVSGPPFFVSVLRCAQLIAAGRRAVNSLIYRAETIGSMLRPAALRDARRAFRRGAIAAPAFKRIEDRAVDAALALQERAGLDVVTDGEQRRASFLGALLEATEGLSRSDDVTKPWHEPAGGVSQLSLGLLVTGKLRRVRSMVA